MFGTKLSDDYKYTLGCNTKRPFKGNPKSWGDKFFHGIGECSSYQFGFFKENPVMDDVAAIVHSDEIVTREMKSLKEDESFAATLHDCSVKPSRIVKNYDQKTKEQYLAEKSAKSGVTP